LLSVLLHGFSALPLARWYANRLKTAPRSIPELFEVPDLEPFQNRLANLNNTSAPLTDPGPESH